MKKSVNIFSFFSFNKWSLAPRQSQGEGGRAGLSHLDDHLQKASQSGWSFAKGRPIRMIICKRQQQWQQQQWQQKQWQQQQDSNNNNNNNNDNKNNIDNNNNNDNNNNKRGDRGSNWPFRCLDWLLWWSVVGYCDGCVWVLCTASWRKYSQNKYESKSWVASNCRKRPVQISMSHSQILGKLGYGWGPIFKVVLEC